jgi:hypothetical protein
MKIHALIYVFTSICIDEKLSIEFAHLKYSDISHF